MQIANETTAIGWVNYLTRFLRRPPGRTFNRDEPGEYRVQVAFAVDDLIALIDEATIDDAAAAALVDEIGARLCPSGLDINVRAIAIQYTRQVNDDRFDKESTVEWVVRRTNDVRLDRVMGAVAMIAASTDFLWER